MQTSDWASLEQSRAAMTAERREALQDLGFGAVVAQRSRRRLLNPDGTFNVQRTGVSFFRSHSLYHLCLNTTWPRFLCVILATYTAINLCFGMAYYLCGPLALDGLAPVEDTGRFLECVFFSVQTFATIGYGKISPATLPAHLLVTVEALVGLLGFALATGLFFARFSRPNARIQFSEHAIIAPYRGGIAFQFRIANVRRNQLLHVNLTLIVSLSENIGGTRKRSFHSLELERSQVMFFPLNWTVVHPILADSPLAGMTPAQFSEADAEFLVLVEGIDDTFSQPVFASSSYKPEQIRWGAKFTNILEDLPDGTVAIDLRRLSETEAVALPSPTPP